MFDIRAKIFCSMVAAFDSDYLFSSSFSSDFTRGQRYVCTG